LKILFTYLTTFSGHGGIEKFNRAFIKVLDEEPEYKLLVSSLHDKNKDVNYLSHAPFNGYGGKRLNYLLGTITKALNSDILIVAHINLAIVAYVAKLLNPRLKIVVIAHGIDVWGKLNFIKKAVLKKADRILSVSNYTKRRVIAEQNVDPQKITVFPNTFDPYFQFPQSFNKNQDLLNRYGINAIDKILITVCRLSFKEAYKGYDKVLESLPEILKMHPEVKYLIAGKYDEQERQRLEFIIKKNKLEGKVIFTGFIKDEELLDHFMLGDVFVMPSLNEGFGIVYIEAMACGLPVIAGNNDGSVDALDNGKLGYLIDPESISEISKTVSLVLENAKNERGVKLDLQQRVREKFDFPIFKNRLKQIIRELN